MYTIEVYNPHNIRGRMNPYKQYDHYTTYEQAVNELVSWLTTPAHSLADYCLIDGTRIELEEAQEFVKDIRENNTDGFTYEGRTVKIIKRKPLEFADYKPEDIQEEIDNLEQYICCLKLIKEQKEKGNYYVDVYDIDEPALNMLKRNYFEIEQNEKIEGVTTIKWDYNDD